MPDLQVFPIFLGKKYAIFFCIKFLYYFQKDWIHRHRRRQKFGRRRQIHVFEGNCRLHAEDQAQLHQEQPQACQRGRLDSAKLHSDPGRPRKLGPHLQVDAGSKARRSQSLQKFRGRTFRSKTIL